MAALIPLLTHLDPPCSCAQVRLDRFSPFHARTAQFGFRKVRPARAYFFVLPLGRRELDRLAYFFDFDYEDNRRPDVYLEPVQRAAQRWWRSRSADPPVRLDARFDDEETIEVCDTREAARHPQYRLTGVRARVFALCDIATTAAALTRHPDLAGLDVDVHAALASLVTDGLMVEEGGHYLTLAVFRNRPAGIAAINSHGHDTAAQAPATRSLLPLV
jgi:hypothetical protein